MSTTKNANTMTPDEMIAEIKDLRKNIDSNAMRMHELAKTLYIRARRTPSSDWTTTYITYANAWVRCAGVIAQGLRRTAVADKVLSATAEMERERKEEDDRRVRRAVREQTVAEAKSPFRRQETTDDLIELYGEEILDDASR